MTFRSLLRSKWPVWLGLALLLGVTAGGVMGGVAGARRTASAYERFRQEHRAYDVIALVDCGALPDDTASSGSPTAGCIDELRRLPSVAGLAVVDQLAGYIATADGRSVQPMADDPCYSGPGRVDVLGDRAGRFGIELNETRIVAGRRADPSAVDEVVLSKSTADRLGLGPGSTLQLSLFDGADCQDDPADWGPPVSLRVVGIGLTPGEVSPPSGEYFASVQVTPAFLAGREAPAEGASGIPVVRLRAGADATTLLADVASIGGQAEILIDARDLGEAVERGIRPQAITLALVAGLATLAGAAVVGQALVRQRRSDSVDLPTLTALGMSRRDHLAVGMSTATFLGVVAGGIGALVAMAVSSLTPVGLAGEIEPDPGASIDAIVILIGSIATVAFVLAVMAMCAWWPSRAASEPKRDSRRRPVAVVDGLAHAGLPTTMVSGVRMALERGSGRDAVPAGTSVAAIAVATFAIVGSLTFGAGITHLVETPRLIGVNWDGLLLSPSVSDAPVEQVELEAALADHPGVTAFAPGTFFPPFPQGHQLQLSAQRRDVAMISFGPGTIGPSVIAGRAPLADDEVLVGPETLEDLGLALGDTVDAYGQAGSWSEPGEETSMPLRVVGVGVIPNTGGDGRLGRGVSLTLGGVLHLNPDASADGFWLQFAEGSDAGAVVAGLLEQLGAPPLGDGSDFFPKEVFGGALAVRDVEQVDRAPQLFAIVMAMMALGVIAHVLVSAMHANRRDLAVLRTLGFRRRDVGRAVAWQSTVYVLAALVIGVPLGIAVGRSAWRVYAERLGVVPEPAVPWLTISVVAATSLIVAVVIALALSRRATARVPATVLRTE